MLNEKMLNVYIKENGNDVIEEVLTSLSLDEIQDIYNYGCSNGVASSYIYYHQTETFFNKYSTECLENVERMKNEYRIDLNEFEFTKNIPQELKDTLYNVVIEKLKNKNLWQ